MRVDWFITRVCDQAAFCGFCNAPWNAFPRDVSTKQSLELCDRLKALGTDTITMCGGEPFKYPGLDVIVRRLHELGIKVVLYTSATCDQHHVESLLGYIDFLSLPVDAASPEIVKAMRGPSQFARVNAVLEMLKTRTVRPKIKIGTVVTRQNINDLSHIGDFLHSFGIIDVWRLYEFSPYGIGKHQESRYVLAPGEFKEAASREETRELQRPGRHILISERTRADNEGYCMIMDSKGAFYRYEERYIPLGVTVNDAPETIMREYDQERHAAQKSWHSIGTA